MAAERDIAAGRIPGEKAMDKAAAILTAAMRRLQADDKSPDESASERAG